MENREELREKYYTARLYMKKLANGIDPIENIEMPEDELLNNVGICRTFNFVSDVLDEVIQNNCVISPPNKRKTKFHITEEQRESITISESPVKLTAISHRIQRALDPWVRGISGIRMAQWLESEGLLTCVIRDGRMHREATDAGNALGIETRMIKQGDKTYEANFYDESAQSFIIANLESIANFQENKNLKFDQPSEGVVEQEEEDKTEKAKKTKKKA